MNVCIIGHFVLDEIHLHDGAIAESNGGIYFAIGAFAGVAGDDDVIFPVVPLGHDAFVIAEQVIRRLHHVSLHGVYTVSESTTRVKLFYDSSTTYNTCLVSELPPIPFEKIEPHLSCDLIYINMMTANDVTLETAEMIRRRSSAIIFLDIHMLAYSVAEMGKRIPQPHPDWKRWCAVADIAQMNEREISVVIQHGLCESKAIEKIFAQTDIRILLLTRGERGASIFSREGHGVSRIDIPAVSLDAVADTTGCGDAFGSAFAYHYVKEHNPATAGSFASFIASRVAMIRGSDGIESLSELVSLHAV